MISVNIARPSEAAVRPRLFRWISTFLFVFLSLFLVAFGAFYASVHDMLWFHAAAVPEAIRDEVRPLYLALMKLIGGASFGLGVLSGYVALGPMRRGARFAGAAVALCIATPILVAAYVAEMLANLTGAPTSWHIMGILLAIDAAAFAAHVGARVRGD